MLAHFIFGFSLVACLMAVTAAWECLARKRRLVAVLELLSAVVMAAIAHSTLGYV